MNPKAVNLENDARLRPVEVGGEAVQRVLSLRTGESSGADQLQRSFLGWRLGPAGLRRGSARAARVAWPARPLVIVQQVENLVRLVAQGGDRFVKRSLELSRGQQGWRVEQGALRASHR